jgi:hypothetical protein
METATSMAAPLMDCCQNGDTSSRNSPLFRTPTIRQPSTVPPIDPRPLFDPASLARLLSVAQAVRARGGQVAFDPNYRPAGWPSRERAQQAIRMMAASVSIALPTLEDESALWGIDNADAVIDHWRELGAREVIVKQGSSGCHLLADEARQRVPCSASGILAGPWPAA